MEGGPEMFRIKRYPKLWTVKADGKLTEFSYGGPYSLTIEGIYNHLFYELLFERLDIMVDGEVNPKRIEEGGSGLLDLMHCFRVSDRIDICVPRDFDIEREQESIAREDLLDY